MTLFVPIDRSMHSGMYPLTIQYYLYTFSINSTDIHCNIALNVYINMCFKTAVQFCTFCTVQLLFPWLRQEGGKTPRIFFNLIKDEYHLELIIYCIYLYVGGGMCCNDP